MYPLGLDGCNNNRIEDIFNSTPAAQVVNRFPQSLDHGAYGQCSGFTLYGLIGIVPRIQVRKNKDGSLPRHFGVGHLRPAHLKVHGGVVLYGSFHFKFGL